MQRSFLLFDSPVGRGVHSTSGSGRDLDWGGSGRQASGRGRLCLTEACALRENPANFTPPDSDPFASALPRSFIPFASRGLRLSRQGAWPGSEQPAAPAAAEPSAHSHRAAAPSWPKPQKGDPTNSALPSRAVLSAKVGGGASFQLIPLRWVQGSCVAGPYSDMSCIGVRTHGTHPAIFVLKLEMDFMVRTQFISKTIYKCGSWSDCN